MNIFIKIIKFFIQQSRKLSFKFYRFLRKHGKRINNESLLDKWLKWLGKNVLARELWIFEKYRIAGGASIGILITLIPIYGFQMLLSALICCKMRKNIPIALAMCLLTNLVTIPPVLYFQMKVGKFFAPLFKLPIYEKGNEINQTLLENSKLLSYGAAGALGILLTSIFFSILTYFLVLLSWEPMAKLIHKIHLPEELLHKKKTKKQIISKKIN